MNGKIFSNVKMLALIAIVVAALSGSAFMLEDNTQAEIIEYDGVQKAVIIEYDGVQKAVIIDQLHYDLPNPEFIQNATEMLEGAGYQVDVYTTEDITVDFYKKLPSMNYQYVIIRSHSADDISGKSVALFTGEEYEEDKYILEQLSGHVVKGAPTQRQTFYPNTYTEDWVFSNATFREMTTSFIAGMDVDDAFFLITPKFVKEAMIGTFPDSTLLIGGCDVLSNTSLAESLVNRGASSIIGWDNTVSSVKNDVMMLEFLQANLVNNMETNEAVNFVMENSIHVESMFFDVTLKHYPDLN